jgi:glucosamine-6-phosphate deaminase
VTILVFDTPAAAATALAQAIADAIRRRPALVLGLPAGRTPVPVYAELRRLHHAGEVDFVGVRTFNLDEFAGLAPTHPASFRRFMQTQLFDAVNLASGRIGFLDGGAPDPPAECHRYEADIQAAGGLDLTVLGLGVNGHIGFNEPGNFLVAGTHVVELHEATRRANAAPFGGLAHVPVRALTVGVGTILRSDSIALIATGASKAAAVAAMVRGPVTTQVPASLLQTHRRVVCYLDREASGDLGDGPSGTSQEARPGAAP